MERLIASAIAYYRTTLLLFVLAVVAGLITYLGAPKEAEPDIPIPFIAVSVGYDGVTSDDAESLIAKPLESALGDVSGIKQVTTIARQGGVDTNIEFYDHINKKFALADVREAVSNAKSDMPEGIREPVVKEITMAGNAPVVTLMVSGDVAESVLIEVARQLEEVIEQFPEVLDVEIVGERDSRVEVLVTPTSLERYGLNLQNVVQVFRANDQTQTPGSITLGESELSLKVPGKVENVEALLDAPLAVIDDVVVKVRDVASVRLGLKKPKSLARFNQRPALALLVKKRSGENILNTVAKVSVVLEKAAEKLPEGVSVAITDDRSKMVAQQVSDLQNSVLASVVLVVGVMVAFLGIKSSLLIAIGIPSAFLIGIMVLLGFTQSINMVSLFGLIMSVGLMVDASIVVVEYASKKLSEGWTSKGAYAAAAKKMAMPIIASTVTTVAAFAPLAVWPGQIGSFLFFLPATTIAILSASLVVSLLVLPVFGAILHRRHTPSEEQKRQGVAIAEGDYENIRGLEGLYARLLNNIVHYPWVTALSILVVTSTLLMGYVNTQPKVEFFPEIEPEGLSVTVKHKGDISIQEKARLMVDVEAKLLPFTSEIETLYTKVGGERNQVGTIRLRLVNWDSRRPAAVITRDIRRATQEMAGVIIEVDKDKKGPAQGKALQILLKGSSKESLYAVSGAIYNDLGSKSYLKDVETSLDLTGVEWVFDIDKEQALESGTSLQEIGSVIKLINEGVKIGGYRSEGQKDEMDVIVRFSDEYRTPESLNVMNIQTSLGDQVALSGLMARELAPRVGTITRVDGREVVRIRANMAEGENLNAHIAQIESSINQLATGFSDVEWEFEGEQQQQKEAGQFLAKAFSVALALIVILMVTQFNSVRQAGLVMSAILFATVGALAFYDQLDVPFSIVMSSIGVISLAGIIVNHNIVLLETFNEQYRQVGRPVRDAIVITCVQRLRPVVMTTITTILGLLPMALQMNVNLIEGYYQIGAPSAQWWYQLSIAVIGGLAFATIVTLVFTPAALMLMYGKSINVRGLVKNIKWKTNN